MDKISVCFISTLHSLTLIKSYYSNTTSNPESTFDLFLYEKIKNHTIGTFASTKKHNL